MKYSQPYNNTFLPPFTHLSHLVAMSTLGIWLIVIIQYRLIMFRSWDLWNCDWRNFNCEFLLIKNCCLIEEICYSKRMMYKSYSICAQCLCDILLFLFMYICMISYVIYLLDSHNDIENFTISSFMLFPDSQYSWKYNVFFIGSLDSFSSQVLGYMVLYVLYIGFRF